MIRRVRQPGTNRNGLMTKPVEPTKKLLNKTDQYIFDTAQLVSASAAENRTLHVSQSFSGTRFTAAVVVCFVTCPDGIVDEIQQAIDAAVHEVLAQHGSKPVMIQ
jgi:hypothetical protein